MTQLGLPRETFQANLAAVAVVVERERPDILAVQEADAPSAWSGRFDHVQSLSAAAGYPYVHHGLHFDKNAGGLRLRYGTALLARRVLGSKTSHSFAARPLDTKGFVTAVIEFVKRPLVVTSVHLDAVSPSTRRRQVEALVSALEDAPGAMIVMGDLNCQWCDESDAVRMLASRLGLRAYVPEGPGLATYRANAPLVRIDWILISPQLRFRDYRVWEDQVSDHLGVSAEVCWRD
jgi:endonuclease/exonuclease/phosphatase family metal-dependent hydrolase